MLLNCKWPESRDADSVDSCILSAVYFFILITSWFELLVPEAKSTICLLVTCLPLSGDQWVSWQIRSQSPVSMSCLGEEQLSPETQRTAILFLLREEMKQDHNVLP